MCAVVLGGADYMGAQSLKRTSIDVLMKDAWNWYQTKSNGYSK